MSYDGSTIGGLNRYTGEMVAALVPRLDRAVVYSNAPGNDSHRGEPFRTFPIKSVARSDTVGNVMRLLWHQTILPNSLRRAGARLFYSPVPEGMLAPVCPQVITVHDLLPIHFPEVYPRLRHYFTRILPRLLRSSSAIVADSEATRADIERTFGELGSRVHVIYPGYRREVFRPVEPQEITSVTRSFGLTRYALAVGETRPYKNIRRLIEAFAAARVPELQLAIVGSLNRLDPGIRQLPALLGMDRDVVFLGTVSDQSLAALYSGAAMFIFPSLHEGFGIPPLEAMACGCPVVASSVSSVPEVCGEAALYVDPLEVSSMAEAIREVAGSEDIRARLRAAGTARAARFSYDSAAERLAALFETIVASH
jgi:glycosyltransferase involved in cell wall biosynthesis